MLLRAPRISKRKQNAIWRCFVAGTPAQQVGRYYRKYKSGKVERRKQIVDVSRDCVNLYYTHWREMIFRSLDRAPQLAGQVEIDQAFFGGMGRKRKEAKRKQDAKLTRKQRIRKEKHAAPQNLVEVVGFYQKATSRVYTHIVETSDVDTLMPLIRLVVPVKSTIYTDKWAAFNPLRDDGYKHYSINHGYQYVDRLGRHINGIERFWSFAKDRLKPMKGVSRRTLPLHIKECEFRWNHREDLRSALTTLIQDQRSHPRPLLPRQKSTGKRSYRRPSPSRRTRRRGNGPASLQP